MPPKGWRKNAEGSFSQPLNADSISIDDILFPKTTIVRLARSILGEDAHGQSMLFARDSQIALQRAATVFVNHLFFYARQSARNHSRSTINIPDVYSALERIQLASFLPVLRHKIEAFENRLAKKKEMKAAADFTKRFKGNDEKARIREPGHEVVEEVVYGDMDNEGIDSDMDDEGTDDDDDDGVMTDAQLLEAEEPEHVEPNPIAALGDAELELRGQSDAEDQTDSGSDANDS